MTEKLNKKENTSKEMKKSIEPKDLKQWFDTYLEKEKKKEQSGKESDQSNGNGVQQMANKTIPSAPKPETRKISKIENVDGTMDKKADVNTVKNCPRMDAETNRRYPHQIFQVIPDQSKFQCMYCTFGDATLVQLQPKLIMRSTIVANLTRDFSQYDWKKIVEQCGKNEWEYAISQGFIINKQVVKTYTEDSDEEKWINEKKKDQTPERSQNNVMVGDLEKLKANDPGFTFRKQERDMELQMVNQMQTGTQEAVREWEECPDMASKSQEMSNKRIPEMQRQYEKKHGEENLKEASDLMIEMKLYKAEMLAAQNLLMELVQTMQQQIQDTCAAVYRVHNQIEDIKKQAIADKGCLEEITTRHVQTIGEQNEMENVEETRNKVHGVMSETEKVKEQIAGIKEHITESMSSGVRQGARAEHYKQQVNSGKVGWTRSGKITGKNKGYEEMKSERERYKKDSNDKERTNKLILFGQELNRMVNIGSITSKLREIISFPLFFPKVSLHMNRRGDRKYVVIEAKSTMDATKMWRQLVQAKKEGRLKEITQVEFKKEDYERWRINAQNALQMRGKRIYENLNEGDRRKNIGRYIRKEQEQQNLKRESPRMKERERSKRLCMADTEGELCFLQPSAKIIEVNRSQEKDTKKFCIIFLNMHGDYRNKMRKLSPFKIFMNNQKADIIGCCETKVVEKIKDQKIDGIKIIHQPSYYRAATSEMKPSNGMCMMISEADNQEIQINKYASNYISTAIFERIPMVVIFVYISPMDRINAIHIDKAWNDVQGVVEIFQKLQYAIIIMGDFNARVKQTGDAINNQSGSRLIEWCERGNLKILNIEQCRGQRTFHANKSEVKIFSIVDYAIVNRHEFWTRSGIKMEVLKQYVASDHYPIRCTFQQDRVDQNKKMVKLHVPYYCRVSSEREQMQEAVREFVKEMEIREKENSKGSTVKERYNTIMMALYKALIGKSVITLKKNPIEERKNGRTGEEGLCEILEEINEEIRTSEHGTEKVKELIGKYQTEQVKQNQKEILRMVGRAREAYEQKNDFEVYRSLRQDGDGEWFPIYESERMIVQDKERLEVITKYYAELYSEEVQDDWELHNDIKVRYGEIMDKASMDKEEKIVTIREIVETAKQLKSHKAMFLDCIPNEVIKMIAQEKPEILQEYINMIIKSPQEIPRKMLASKLTIIPKKTCPTSPEETRGIRVKSAMLTLLDKIILKKIRPVIEQELCKEQGGFRKETGTINQIIMLRMVLYHAKHISKKRTYVINIDFQKAFDSVWHKGLMVKLEKIGIRGGLLGSINSILRDGSVIPEVDGYYGKPIRVRRGNGQGYSTSGPLFNVYINDLIKEIDKVSRYQNMYGEESPKCLMYADDLITWANNDEEAERIVATIESYCRKWKLKTNIDKSTVTVINGTNKEDNNWNKDGMREVVDFKYLGIIMDLKSGSWNKHIDQIVGKLKNIYIIASNRGIIGGLLPVELQVKYYKTVVRPIIEYGIQTFRPTVTQMKKLEAIQHRYLTKISGTYITTRYAAIRVLIGIAPIKARADLLRLRAWYDIMQQNNIQKKFAILEMRWISGNVERIQNQREKSYTLDVYNTLQEYGLEDYWRDEIDMTKKQWEGTIKERILKKTHENDINEIEKSQSCIFLRELTKSQSKEGKYYTKIQKIGGKEHTRSFAPFARIITGNPNMNWKRVVNGEVERQTKTCPWCLEQWNCPIGHVVLECKKMETIRTMTIKQKENKEENEMTSEQFFMFCKKAFSNSKYV
ncbi:hypothetical protein RFI_17147 [Reticulomyxa filosa]|uniref:Reverse transcriptase domain-containing protein n=1 Tax=Reticulomyxa filosa TaxID=46433 RepID=X6N1W6_RETFI|nr:hypothetical protein RFI_17147 [Reticulomyxa filosa]|eukprot:ETO20071.1 hypothetical protein RFI_17147 [Reticulomyxa filosa]